MKTPNTKTPDNTPRGTVWVVTITLHEEIMAVGTNLPTALHWAGVKAAEYLTLCDRLDDQANPWTAATVAEFFGYNATECEIDGDGQYH